MMGVNQEEADERAVATANGLLEACSLPPFVSSLVELQPVVVLSLIERLVDVTFGKCAAVCVCL
jgi:hypothetical protein